MAAAVLPPPGDPKTLYVMDLSGYVFRAYHAVPPLSNSKGEPTHAVLGVTAMMNKLITQRRPTYFAVAVDSRAPSFRKAIYADYKATRKERPPDLEQQADRVLEIAHAYQIPCLAEEGMEADDVIATVVKQAREQGLTVVIASADKDLLQLIQDGVVMLDSMRDRVYGPEETVEKMGVRPDQVRDYLSLTGDTSDNVPGVPGVGPKTAVQLLGAYETLDGIYAQVDAVEKKSIREKLIANKDKAYLSQQLVSLKDDVAIDFDLERLRYGGADVPKLRQLFTDLELHRAKDELERTLGREVPRGALETAPSKPAARAEIVTKPKGAPPPRLVVKSTLAGDLDALRAALDAARASGGIAIHTLIEGDDPLRAQVVGVALGWREVDEVAETVEARAVYAPIGHVYLGRPDQLPLASVVELLRPVLEDRELAKRAHDLKREALVWSRRGVRVRIGEDDFDTMIASYLLDAERHAHGIEEVARLDLGDDLASLESMLPKVRGQKPRLSELEVERAMAAGTTRAALILDLEALQRQRLDEEALGELMRTMEMPLAGVLADMEQVGVRIDTAHLAQLDVGAEARVKELEKRCHEAAGHEFNVSSPRALESVLFDELKLPVIKRTKTSRSTDHEVLEELAPMHPLPDAILELRMLQKLRGTYLEALPRQIDPADQRVHTRFNQAVAATGRLSSSDPNLQNIPIRTDEGRAIRDAFVAADGFEILSADYSQIELRVLAHASGDVELVDAFTTNADVHVRTATALFGVTPEGVTRDMRGRAKTVNFAVIYGQTEFALARNLRIDRAEARRYIDAFFVRYAGVTRYLQDLVHEAQTTGAVRTLLGRKRVVPDIDSRNRALRFAAERIAKNTPIQGSAADILKRAMIGIHDELAARELRSRMILTVHDELVLEVAQDEKDVVAKLVREKMETAFPLEVPLVVEMGFGRTWGAAH
ncbi:DNA polymerase I [Sandaracinus amylolyticus]|uniref:DNA polymerase I n=1 Tax=Sandaracinus amylolyticus TaxID=927083 RepID=UPI001F01454C|nr:DNA polymerase I [Sandaracinus amylolyticus]UJR80667.1 DNA polymerase I [Sandaracinus amylolyticus]